MLMRKLYFMIVLLILGSVQLFAQVESTANGGAWSSVDTWKDHVVPTLNDYVIIKGPVTLSPSNITEAYSIEIKNLPDAGLAPDPTSTLTNKLYVGNYLWNNGTISGQNLDIYIGGSIGGSIYNLANGTWNSGVLYIVDTLTHPLISEGKWFHPSYIRADSATLVSAGNIEIDSTKIYVRKIIVGQNLQNEKFILNHHSILHVDKYIDLSVTTNALKAQHSAGIGDTLIVKNNSEISSFISSGNYNLSQFTDVNLKGEILLNGPSTFIGETRLYGVMMPDWSNHLPVYVLGNFYNYGEIKSNAGSYFKFYISGNLTNEGLWNTYELNFTGTSAQELSMDITYPFRSEYFNADSSTIYSTSDLRFDISSGSNATLRLKKIVLQKSNSLDLNGTTLMVDEIIGNGNIIQFNNNSMINSYISQGKYTLSQFTDVILNGEINMRGPTTFLGETNLKGVMISPVVININVNGNFYNNGEISTNSYGYNVFNFYITGNLENNGKWAVEETHLTGTTAQHVGISDTLVITTVIIDANRGGNSFQWMLNGNQLSNGGDISGATSNILTINNFDSNYFGTIKCEIDSSGNSITSRVITVNDVITEIEIDNGSGNGNGGKDGNNNQIPKIFALLQNYPNPFNPITKIKYFIPQFSFVSVKVYNILGEEIETLVNEKKQIGNYEIDFDAGDLAGGVYFYRLTAGQLTACKKLLLLK